MPMLAWTQLTIIRKKNALFREEDFAFINSLKNMTQKESENSSGTKLCSGNQRKDHFRLESVKWRAASRNCHHIKRFRQMKEKRFWWSPSKPLQATNKSTPTGKKTITAQKVVAISGLQQEKLSTVTYWQCICSITTAKFAFKPTQIEWRG